MTTDSSLASVTNGRVARKLYPCDQLPDGPGVGVGVGEGVGVGVGVGVAVGVGVGVGVGVAVGVGVGVGVGVEFPKAASNASISTPISFPSLPALR